MEKFHGHFPFHQRPPGNGGHRRVVLYLPEFIVFVYSVTTDHQRALGHGIDFPVRTGERGLQERAPGKASGVTD